MITNMKIENSESQCKGLFFKGYNYVFSDLKGKIKSSKELRLLKKKSCTGCEDCEWFWDFLGDTISEEYGLLDNIEYGKIYTPKIRTSREWESGFEEPENIEFIEVLE